MGMDLKVPRVDVVSIARVIERLAAAGMTASVVMVDGQLHAPSATVPDGWREVRLRLAAGTVTVRVQPDGISVMVFGNADAALINAQRAIATAIKEA